MLNGSAPLRGNKDGLSILQNSHLSTIGNMCCMMRSLVASSTLPAIAVLHRVPLVSLVRVRAVLTCTSLRQTHKCIMGNPIHKALQAWEAFGINIRLLVYLTSSNSLQLASLLPSTRSSLLLLKLTHMPSAHETDI